MMHIFHLIWIVPIAAFIGYIVGGLVALLIETDEQRGGDISKW